MPKRVDPDAAWNLMVQAGVTPQVPYPGNGPWRCLCNKCNSVVFPRYYTVKRGIGACSECAKTVKVRKNAERGLEATKKRLVRFGFEAVDPISNARTSIAVRCIQCKEVSQRYLAGIDKPCVCSREPRKTGEKDSLEHHYPGLAKNWDYSKNSLLPSEVASHSGKRFWFICAFGHSFDQVVDLYVKSNAGCPICSGRRILPGSNDLVTLAPVVAAEWHHAMNSIEPDKVSAGLNKKVWWLGRCGHEWEASPNKRVYGKQGCPVCQNLKLVVGQNDLATTHIELARQWHPTRNQNTPRDVVWGTHEKVWWLGSCGHEWESSVVNRASKRGSGCPYCGGRKTLWGFNDVASLPIAAQWDFQKNKLSIENVNRGTPRKAWWRCDAGHSYQMQVNLKVKRPKSCPVCSRKVLQVGVNDFATTHPDLLAEWDASKNLGLDPASFTSGSREKAWWKCDRGHSWRQTIGARQKFGCPYCSGRFPILGETDLATTHPLLAQEWHLTKNDKRPSEVSFGSEYKAWWSGPCGHEWPQPVGARVRGSGCPECAPVGYSSLRPGLLYFVVHSWSAGKIGITNIDAKQSRLDALRTVGFQVVETWQRQDGQVIRDLETKALRWVRKELGLGPYFGKEEMGRIGGWSETFSMDDLSTEEVCNKIGGLLLELEDRN